MMTDRGDRVPKSAISHMIKVHMFGNLPQSMVWREKERERERVHMNKYALACIT